MAGRKDNEEEVLEIEGEEEQAEGEGEGEGEPEDRGDDPDPAVNLKTLKKVAGAEEEGEGDGEGDGEEEAEGKGPPKTVPYSRLAKEVAKGKALEEELEQLRASKGKGAAEEEAPEEEVEAFDFDAKEEAYLKAASMGEYDEAKKIRREINAALKAEAMVEATNEAVKTINASESQREFGKAVAETLKAHPWLNDKGDDADPDAIEQVVALRNLYISKGKSAADALREAAAKVAKTRPKAEPEEEEGEEGEDDGKGKKKPTAKEIAEAARAKEARKRGALAAEDQPAALKGKGNRTSEGAQLNIEDMTEEEFDALPEAEKKKARGD
jgi:hypothetical protein